MRWLEKLMLRWRSLFRRPEVEQELDAELRFHLQQQIDENLAAGMSAAEASYAACRTIGGLTQIQEECRDTRRLVCPYIASTAGPLCSRSLFHRR